MIDKTDQEDITTYYADWSSRSTNDDAWRHGRLQVAGDSENIDFYLIRSTAKRDTFHFRLTWEEALKLRDALDELL